MTQVFLVETDQHNRAELKLALQSHGFSVIEAPSDGNDIAGMDLSRADCIVATPEPLAHLGANVLEMAGSVPVVMVDYRGDARQAVQALKRGASDYLVAPFHADELAAAVERGKASARHAGPPRNMVGTSAPMMDLFDLIAKVAPTDSTVLIEGESGTGKELVARALHAASARRHAPLITLNCATVPPQLIEPELFGHPATAATNQSQQGHGLLQAADCGTLFLDEVGELPLAAQARVLRVLQDGQLSEFGDTAARRVDVRLISTTHRNLKQLIANGQFREDLYYRLNVISLRIAPLRQRGDDILLLADTILSRTSERLLKPCSGISAEAKDVLMSHTWPGNVRELENAIERAVILCSGGEIAANLLAIDLGNRPASEPAPAMQHQTSLEDYFVSFVTAHQDQLTETELAAKLGISRKSLWERRQRLNIPRKKTRKRGPRRGDS